MPKLNLISQRLFASTRTILLLGLVLRLAVAPFTLNWDLLINTQVASKLLTGSFADIFTSPLSAYPPIMYSLLVTCLKILSPFLGTDFTDWLQLQHLTALSHPHIYRYLFLLKLPFISIELVAGLIFSRLFSRHQNQILLTWMLNPIAIYLVPIFTNVDAVPVFFIILAFFLLHHRQPALSSLSLSLATAFKIFPIFMAPFFFLYYKTNRQRLIFMVCFLFPLILSQYFVLHLPGYQEHVLTSNNNRTIFFSSINIGIDRFLLYFALIYALILMHFSTLKPTFTTLFKYSFFAYLPIFVFSHFHLQWALWIIPLLLTLWRTHPPTTAFQHLAIYGSYFAVVIFSAASLHIGMLAPVAPELWFLPDPSKTLFGHDADFYASLTHSLFAGILIWSAYHIHQSKHLFSKS